MQKRKEHLNYWSPQQIAITGVIFSVWKQATELETTAQPLQLKTASIVRLLNKEWKQCGLTLQPGVYVRRLQTRYDFDGDDILQFVAKHRANTRNRTSMIDLMREQMHKYYQVGLTCLIV